MIPYIEWTTIQIGPITLYVWGLFVALGFIVGHQASSWMVKRRGFDESKLQQLLVWLMLAGLVGGRAGYVLFYHPSMIVEDPLSILYIWQGGMSVFGGFIACVLVSWWYLRCHRIDFLPFADAAIFGLPLGLGIGRLGCFMIHDHPGLETAFFLGVQYPDGIVRHDHGLYLSLNGFMLAFVFWLMSRRRLPTGAYLAVFMVWYGLVRFGLDFWRLNEVRYGLLTPAQYFCLIFVGFGFWLIYKKSQNKQNRL